MPLDKRGKVTHNFLIGKDFFAFIFKFLIVY